jgi:hypothetical protein
MLVVPGTERSSVDLDDGILHQDLNANELIVGCVVHHIQNSRLAGHDLRAPREIANVQTQRLKLGIPSTNSDTPHFVHELLGQILAQTVECVFTEACITATSLTRLAQILATQNPLPWRCRARDQPTLRSSV